jgi:hypothetical protein
VCHGACSLASGDHREDSILQRSEDALSVGGAYERNGIDRGQRVVNDLE